MITLRPDLQHFNIKILWMFKKSSQFYEVKLYFNSIHMEQWHEIFIQNNYDQEYLIFGTSLIL